MIHAIHNFILNIVKNKWRTFAVFALLSWAISSYAYYAITKDLSVWIFINGFNLSFADMPEGNSGLIVTGKIMWMLTFASAVMALAVKDFVGNQSMKYLTLDRNNRHAVVVGDNAECIIDAIRKDDKDIQIITLNTKREITASIDHNERDVFVISGDLNSKSNWKKVGVGTCKYIIVSHTSDSYNIDIAENISAYLTDLKKIEDDKELHGIIGKIDVTLGNHKNSIFSPFLNKEQHEIIIYSQIESYKTMSMSSNKDNIIFFNNSFNAIRNLYQTKPIFTGVDIVGVCDNNNQVNDSIRDQVSLLVIGLGSIGSYATLEAIKMGHFYNGKPIKITVVEKNMENIVRFKKYYNIKKLVEDKYIEIDFINAGINTNEFDRIVDNFDFSYVVMSINNDDATQLLLQDMVLKLKQKQDNSKLRIPFAVGLSSGLPLRAEDDTVDIFRIADIDINHIIDNTLNEDAMALHTGWQSEEILKKDPTGGWSKQTFLGKDKNYAPADHQVVKKQILTTLMLIKDHGSIQDAVSIKEKDTHSIWSNLSVMQQRFVDVEHRRWNVFHIVNGFKYKAVRNDHTRQHHCLILPTEDLEALGNSELGSDGKILGDYFSKDLVSWKKVWDDIESSAGSLGEDNSIKDKSDNITK